MPFDGNGNFFLVAGTIATSGQTILVSQHNPAMQDFASAFNSTFLRTGVTPMLANLNFNTFKGVNLANGTAAGDAVNFGQLSALDPLGVPKPYLGATAPSGHIFCFGQAISRTTYAALFAVLGVVYGPGNGTTTFNVPDLRGRVLAGKDDMGGTSANRLTGLTGGVNGDNLAAVGGAESHVLTEAQLAEHDHGGATGAGGAFSPDIRSLAASTSVTTPGDSRYIVVDTTGTGTLRPNGIENTPNHVHSIPDAGTNAPHNNVQPTIIVNYILRTGV